MNIKRDSFNPNTGKGNINQQKKLPKYPMKGQPSLSTKENRNIRSANPKNSPSKFPPLSQNPTATEFINNAIHEYLVKKEMANTLECFKDELHSIGGRRSVESSYEIQILEVKSIKIFVKENRPSTKDKENSSLINGINIFLSMFGSKTISAPNLNSICIFILLFTLSTPTLRNLVK